MLVALQVGSGTCIHLHFTCISFGAFSHSLESSKDNSTSIFLALEVASRQCSIISFYVRIITHLG